MLGKKRYPTSVSTNNYFDNRKNSTVYTPALICQTIFKIIHSYSQNKIILDIGCGSGNLSRPFISSGYTCIGIDKENAGYPQTFYQFDFLSLTKETFQITPPSTIIVCNPPFNNAGGTGRKLLPELFIKKMYELVDGYPIPIVLFCPMGFLKNQKKSSSRWKWLRDCGWQISSELELPIDVYNEGDINVLVHSSVLFFNFSGLQGRYFLPDG